MRRKTRRGDDVIRKRLSGPRIVNKRIVGATCQLCRILAEVATRDTAGANLCTQAGVHQQFRWHSLRTRNAGSLPLPLIVTEEEESIFYGRTADRPAKLVVETAWKYCDSEQDWRLKRIARQIRVAPPIVEGAAMEVVGARLGLRRHHGRYSLAELSVEVLRCDLRLSDRVERRIHNDDAQNRILIVRAVQFERGATESLAIDLNLLARLRVLVGCVAPAQLLCARKEQLQAGKVAPGDRQIRNCLLVECGGHVRAIRLQLRNGIGVDVHRLARAAGLHRCIYLRRRVSQHLQMVCLKGLEAGHLHLDCVEIRNQVFDRIAARIVGFLGDGGALRLICDCHGCTRDGCT